MSLFCYLLAFIKLARELSFFYSAFIYFLKPLLAVESSRDRAGKLGYLVFCYGRLSISSVFLQHKKNTTRTEVNAILIQQILNGQMDTRLFN